MELEFRDLISITFVWLQILAFILNGLVDREAGIDPNPPMKLLNYGHESILHHLPKRTP